MEYVIIIVQIIIALSIFNVWILRYGKSSEWRAGSAKNMKEEFEAYGLPIWFMNGIGFLKLLFAILLLLGIWFPDFTKPAAIGIAILMIGAIFMHVKVKDPLKKSLPAFSLLVLSMLIILV